MQSKELVQKFVELNGDGIGDLVTVTYHPDFNAVNPIFTKLAYRIGNADGTFGNEIVLHNQCSVSPEVGDFNNDGKMDIAYVYYFCQSQGGDNRFYLKILTNIGNGVFSESAPVQVLDNLSDVADFDNDQKVDLVGTFNSIFMNSGNSIFPTSQLPDNPAPNFPVNFYYREYQNIAVDINGDGSKDILFKDSFKESLFGVQKRYFSAYINDGSGNFSRTNYAKPFNGIAVNMDSDPEIEQVVFVNSTTGAPLYNAVNQTSVLVKNANCQQVVTPRNNLLDFGGDGISDLVMWNPNTGNWRIISNVNEITINWGLGSLGDIPAPGDFDGDGKTDATVYRNSTGEWYVLRSSDQSWYQIKFGLEGDIPVPGDYNGDGVWEIAVFRPSDGNWYLWDVANQQFSGVHFGVSEDKPVPQDYDGDGKIDIAVYRPSTGTWYYLKSSNQNFTAVKWGVSTDIPIPADYDSDGKADLTVFRPGDSVWYILKSFDNEPTYFQFGTPNIVPMPIDSNGDGSIEIGFYYPTNLAWYATGQSQSVWGRFGDGNEIPVRILIPNSN